ncbi:hypothetical protein EDB85DRAFT_1892640 [Lactarius pseudohatsudake]|nr:hypothetical protein EDB85DRAFT_1892640 [Lactarius pseudohatsudake]
MPVVRRYREITQLAAAVMNGRQMQASMQAAHAQSEDPGEPARSRIDSPAVTCTNTDARYQSAYDLERHHAWSISSCQSEGSGNESPSPNIPGLELERLSETQIWFTKNALIQSLIVERLEIDDEHFEGYGSPHPKYIVSYLVPNFIDNMSVDPRVTEGRCETRVGCPLFARERVGRVTIEAEPEEPELGRRGKSNKILTTSAMKNPLPSISSTPRETKFLDDERSRDKSTT